MNPMYRRSGMEGRNYPPEYDDDDDDDYRHDYYRASSSYDRLDPRSSEHFDRKPL